jgi:Rrf2 family iron-sulfur cluster assembly transcriptional regulator
MLQVTSGSDYGIRGVIYLALRSPRGTMLISEIASAEEIPESYLAKIFQGLTRQGILRSTRGVGGGFSLARRPDRITLKDIVMACEGPILVARCLPNSEECDKKEICGMCYVWEKLQDCIVSTLGHTTIQDVLNVIAERKAKQEVM